MPDYDDSLALKISKYIGIRLLTMFLIALMPILLLTDCFLKGRGHDALLLGWGYVVWLYIIYSSLFKQRLLGEKLLKGTPLAPLRGKNLIIKCAIASFIGACIGWAFLSFVHAPELNELYQETWAKALETGEFLEVAVQIFLTPILGIYVLIPVFLLALAHVWLETTWVTMVHKIKTS